MRFTIVAPEVTTEQPYAKFETTQVYLPEDFTTADVEFVDKLHHAPSENHAAIVNPYAMDFGDDARHHDLHAGDAAASLVDDSDPSAADDEDVQEEGANKRMNNNRKQGKKRRSGSGRRRRLENENGQTGRGHGSRYKRHAILHDADASADTDRWAGSKLAAEGDVYYVHVADILKSREPNRQLRAKLHKLKQKAKMSKCLAGNVSEKCKKLMQKLKEQQELEKHVELEEQEQSQHKVEQSQPHHRRRGDSHAAELDQRDMEPRRWRRRRLAAHGSTGSKQAKGDAGQLELLEMQPREIEEIGNQSSSAAVALQRVKRKSGKTTGALSRPKGGSDSGSKTTSRKDKGKAG